MTLDFFATLEILRTRHPAWLSALPQRSFVGTGSRLLTLFDLLKQMRG